LILGVTLSGAALQAQQRISRWETALDGTERFPLIEPVFLRKTCEWHVEAVQGRMEIGIRTEFHGLVSSIRDRFPT
jgi:hypothetical protein